MYYSGKGLSPDYVQAHKWFSLDASQNSEYIETRDAIEEEMTKEQIAESKKLALEFVPIKETTEKQ